MIMVAYDDCNRSDSNTVLDLGIIPLPPEFPQPHADLVQLTFISSSKMPVCKTKLHFLGPSEAMLDGHQDAQYHP
jgi:hypothetical protein